MRQAHREVAKVAETDKLDRLLCQDLPDQGSAQGLQFGFAFGGVVGWEIQIDVAWMAAQFADAFSAFRLQHPGKALHADLLQMGLPAPLAVEFGEVTDRRVFAQGQSMFPRKVTEVRKR